MNIKNNKFYITKSELEDLQKIINMLCSKDLEQSELGFSLYQEIVPENINVWFVKYDSKIQYVSTSDNSIRIRPDQWIII